MNETVDGFCANLVAPCLSELKLANQSLIWPQVSATLLNQYMVTV